MKALLYVFVAVTGALTSVEAGANTKLTATLGGPWWAAILFSLLSLLPLAIGAGIWGGAFPSGQLAAVPWWGWIGGGISALYIMSMLVAPGQLGSRPVHRPYGDGGDHRVHRAGPFRPGRVSAAHRRDRPAGRRGADGGGHRLRGRVLRQAAHTLTVATEGKGLVPVTAALAAWVGAQGVEAGLLTLFIRHTSASLLVQENADPTVRADLEAFFRWLVPEDVGYRHSSEGPDDMPAHIRSALTQTQLSIPVQDGRMVLGTWQGVYVWEHRTAPHRREIALHLFGS